MFQNITNIEGWTLWRYSKIFEKNFSVPKIIERVSYSVLGGLVQNPLVLFGFECYVKNGKNERGFSAGRTWPV